MHVGVSGLKLALGSNRGILRPRFFSVDQFAAIVALLLPLVVVAQVNQVKPSVSLGPDWVGTANLVELNNEITIAPAEKIYSVSMILDEPAPLGLLREVASHLEILRLLAHVEYGPAYDGYERAKVPVGVGTLYDDDRAWRHQTCRAKLFTANRPGDPLLRTPPDEWQVTEIHVYGRAAAVRELRIGSALPHATILDGRASGARSSQPFAAHIKSELAEKIQVPDGRVPPEECREFTQRIEAPILTGQSTIQWPVYDDSFDLNFRAAIRDHLAARDPETPVTVQITLNSAGTTEDFAKLVETYELEGLSAELSPDDEAVRAIMPVEIGLHGGPISDQVRRTRCHMGLGVGANVTEWYGRRARVSTTVANVWKLVDEQDLVDARLLSEFELGALRAVENYYRGKNLEPAVVDGSVPISDACRQYLRH